MPEKVRVVYKPDGSVAVIHPAPKSKEPNETEADWLNRVFVKCMEGDLNGLPYKDVLKATLPPNRDDRDAWEATPGQGITVNAAKVAQIKAAKERKAKIEAEKELLAEESLIAKGEL